MPYKNKIAWVVIMISIVLALYIYMCQNSKKTDEIFGNKIKEELSIVFLNKEVTCELIRHNVGDGNDSWCEVNFEAELLPENNIVISHNSFCAKLEGGKKYRIQGLASFVRQNKNIWKMSWIHFFRVENLGAK